MFRDKIFRLLQAEATPGRGKAKLSAGKHLHSWSKEARQEVDVAGWGQVLGVPLAVAKKYICPKGQGKSLTILSSGTDLIRLF